MKRYFLPLVLFFFINNTNYAQTCSSYPCYKLNMGTTLTLKMWDSYGDGWNGTVWSVFGGCSNGEYYPNTSLVSYSLQYGSYNYGNFYCPPGNWGIECVLGNNQSEVYWELWEGNFYIMNGGAPYYQWNNGFNVSPYCSTGCIDQYATNYNPNAYIQMSASDCTYGPPPSSGCTDPTAINYDPNATTDDGSCTYTILGCTDPSADNYDPTATIDDSTCQYNNNPQVNSISPNSGDQGQTLSVTISGSNMDYGNQWSGTLSDFRFNQWSGSNMFYGNPTSTSGNNLYGDVSIPSNQNSGYYDLEVYDQSSGNWIMLNSAFEVFNISGCTDPSADNYDPTSTNDDGSCMYPATVNFSVDAGAVVTAGLDNVVINGSFAGPWYGWGVTLSDPDGDGIYDGTLMVDPGTYEYVHALTGSDDGWSGWGLTGYAPAGGSCEVAGTGNYGFTVASGDVLNIPTVCFASCDVCAVSVDGCTDPAADNYNPLATLDDGSCTSPSCNEDSPTGLFVDGIIHSRAVINWDNMNSASCVVDQYRIRYQEVGTSGWTQKTMGAPVGSCTYGNNRTDKLLLDLTGATTYEYQMKAWYCGGGSSAWAVLNTFTTADICPNVGNFTAIGASPTKATFDWDDSNGSYEFVRIKMRIDSISSPMGSDWFQVGGFGVLYGTYTKNKNGLVAGETYRAQARSFCDPNGGAYFSLSWSPLVVWTQPTSVRLEGGSAIANLTIFPNPSTDVFNISFTSEGIQDLKVKVLNVIGEELINENLEQFIGEYTKQIDLTKNAKGIYFLEITTNDGVINKKLILQ